MTTLQLADAHAALSSITAALKSNEYLGYDSRKRLLLHAAVVRRGLEAVERDALTATIFAEWRGKAAR